MLSYSSPEIRSEIDLAFVVHALIQVTTDIERKRMEMEDLKMQQAVLTSVLDGHARSVYHNMKLVNGFWVLKNEVKDGNEDSVDR